MDRKAYVERPIVTVPRKNLGMGNYDMERDTASLKIERVEQGRWINERFDVKLLIRSSVRRTKKQRMLWNKACVSRKQTSFLSL